MTLSTYKIPYNINPKFGGGADSTDLWEDEFGDKVYLLASDSGSFYVCPENLDGPFRIYVNSMGREFGMNRDSSGNIVKPEWFDKKPSFADIRLAAINSYPGLFDTSLPASTKQETVIDYKKTLR